MSASHFQGQSRCHSHLAFVVPSPVAAVLTRHPSLSHSWCSSHRYYVTPLLPHYHHLNHHDRHRLRYRTAATCSVTPPQQQPSTRGPQTPPPDYTRIDANPFNILFTRLFLQKLESELHRDGNPTTITTAPVTASRDYAGVVSVVRNLKRRHRGNPVALRRASQRVLLSLFPVWLPPAFAALFSRPVPAFAAWINAAVTVAVTQWLMGPSRLASDNVTVEIERCRYLEGKSPQR